MEKSFKILLNYKNLSLCLLFAFLLTLVNINFSRDIAGYQLIYTNASNANLVDVFLTPEAGQDPLFFFIQILINQVVPFEIFIFIVIFISLFIKMEVILSIPRDLNLLFITPYFAFLGILHEGTQLRIALALAFMLWGIVSWFKDKRLTSLVIFLIAFGIHASSIIYLIIFFGFYLFKYLGKNRALALGLLCLMISYFYFDLSFLKSFDVPYLQLYIRYLEAGVLQTQNTSGLFWFYPVIIASLVAGNFFWFSSSSDFWNKLYIFANISGIVAVIILYYLSSSVIISSRFADLLLMPVLLIWGETIARFYVDKRYFLLISCLFFFVTFGMVRIYISFGEQINNPIFKNLIS
jgi:hypothetical protein